MPAIQAAKIKRDHPFLKGKQRIGNNSFRIQESRTKILYKINEINRTLKLNSIIIIKRLKIIIKLHRSINKWVRIYFRNQIKIIRIRGLEVEARLMWIGIISPRNMLAQQRDLHRVKTIIDPLINKGIRIICQPLLVTFKIKETQLIMTGITKDGELSSTIRTIQNSSCFNWESNRLENLYLKVRIRSSKLFKHKVQAWVDQTLLKEEALQVLRAQVSGVAASHNYQVARKAQVIWINLKRKESNSFPPRSIVECLMKVIRTYKTLRLKKQTSTKKQEEKMASRITNFKLQSQESNILHLMMMALIGTWATRMGLTMNRFNILKINWEIAQNVVEEVAAAADKEMNSTPTPPNGTMAEAEMKSLILISMRKVLSWKMWKSNKISSTLICLSLRCLLW